MKKFIFCFLSLLVGFSACQKDEAITSDFSSDFSNDEPLEKFTAILSEAVCESESLRSFLKEEALKKFDKDYDVFYHYIKDKTIDGTYSFRDVLLKYASEKDICEIEDALPLLNIYIPDLSWISAEAFNVSEWDTSISQIAVCNTVNNNLYADGECFHVMSDGMIPEFPILVVKNNERLRVKSMTKSGEYEYDFISDSYNGTITTKVDPVYEETELPTEVCDNYCSSDKISPSAIAAWNEFKNYPAGCERDYIYYGQTQTNHSGTLNTRVRDRILRFRIDPQIYESLCDDTSDGDPVFGDVIEEKSWNGSGLSAETLKTKIWKDGYFEIELEIFTGVKGGAVSTQKLKFSIPPSQLFQMNAVSTEFYHKTMFSKRKWIYTFGVIKENGEVKNLEPKWYYPNDGTFIVPWDLNNMSDNIIIFAREVDQEKTIKTTSSYAFKFATNLKFNATINAFEKVSLGVDMSGSTENTETSSLEIQRYEDSDELGSLSIRYMDPIITGNRVNDDGSIDYELFSVSSGSIELSLMPEVY